MQYFESLKIESAPKIKVIEISKISLGPVFTYKKRCLNFNIYMLYQTTELNTLKPRRFHLMISLVA